MPDLSYDQIDALVDVDPIALRDVAWKLTQDVARLEAERDEVVAQGLDLLGQRSDAAILRRQLAVACSCGMSPMTYEGPEVDCPVHGAVRAFNEASAELARLRPVVEAAKAFREAAANPKHSQFWRQPWSEMADLCRAVDQLREVSNVD